jgi:hypothetical protein
MGIILFPNPLQLLKDACLATAYPLLFAVKEIAQPEDLEQEDHNDGSITLN